MTTDDDRREVFAELDAIDREIDRLEQLHGAHEFLEETRARSRALRQKWQRPRTLDDVIAKVDAQLQTIFDGMREQLIAQFAAHATAEELTAILARHDETCADAQQRARGVVTGVYFTGTAGIH